MHPELAAHGSFQHLKLGRLPGRPRDAAQLARYIDEAALPPAPATIDYAGNVDGWPMYGNDRIGDCTCAAVGHMIECWTANAGCPRTPADADVEGLYWATGSGDTGRVEQDVLNYWRSHGVAGDRIAGYAAVEPTNGTHVRAACWLFGGLYIGVALPISAQRQQVWDVAAGPDGEPGSWGGHAVNVVAYDDDGLTVVTWGATLRMTWAFWNAYVDECYAIVSPDWLEQNGDAPSGLDIDQLQADLEAL